jgi:hypothetical protein
MITFSSIKCVPGRYLRNWLMSVSACAQTFIPGSCLIIVKVTTSCSKLSQGSSLSTRNKAEEHAMEASIISCCKEIPDATIGRQVDVDYLLGFSRAHS